MELFILFGGAIALLCALIQIFLSRMRSGAVGLVLPGLSFVSSVVVLLTSNWLIHPIIFFGLQNALTALLLVVHFVVRKRVVTKREIEKMNAKDF